MKNFGTALFISRKFILCAGLMAWAVTRGEGKEQLVYFGTFAKTGSKGIYVSRLDTTTGKLTPPELAGETRGAGFLAVHPNRRFLYAVGELAQSGDKPTGAVNAFALDAQTGALTFLNQQSSGGKGPAHLVVDQTGKNVLVANYGGGNVAVLPIQSDGRLGGATAFMQHTGSSVNPQRQKEPHAHSINLDGANRLAFVADLGLDKVMIYQFDAEKGSLTVNDPPFAVLQPGAGPRHMVFHHHNRFAYVINEMQCTMTAFRYNSQRGELKETQTVSTLPDGQAVEAGFSTAEVQVHPSGRFLYGSNRGHNTIAVFEIEGQTGEMKLIQNEPTQGKTPRHFGLDPTGKFLLVANQDSDSVVVFRVDPKTGKLLTTGEKITVPMPVCVKFLELPSTDAPAVAQWPTDDRFAGKGPLQKAAWFQGLWASRRLEWAKTSTQDKGAVVFLGDSITQGWSSLMKDFAKYKVVNRGISGDTTRGVLFRLPEDVLDLDPEAIVLLIGTNDIGLNGTPEDAAANIKAILAAIKARNAKTPVVICKVMPSTEKMFRPPDKLQNLNALIDEIIQGDAQFIHCDTWSIFADENGAPKVEEFPDGLHPNGLGYAKWTKVLEPILAKLNLSVKN